MVGGSLFFVLGGFYLWNDPYGRLDRRVVSWTAMGMGALGAAAFLFESLRVGPRLRITEAGDRGPHQRPGPDSMGSGRRDRSKGCRERGVLVSLDARPRAVGGAAARAASLGKALESGHGLLGSRRPDLGAARVAVGSGRACGTVVPSLQSASGTRRGGRLGIRPGEPRPRRTGPATLASCPRGGSTRPNGRTRRIRVARRAVRRRHGAMAVRPTLAEPPADRGADRSERVAPSATDIELLRALDQTEPQRARAALAELWARHAAATLAFLERLGGQRAVAEDVLSDVFLRVAEPGRAHRGGSVRAWILTIAANRLRDRRREGRRRAERERTAARHEPVAPGEPAVLDDELEAALATLPVQLRAAVELRHSQQLPHADVARVLGVSLRTAKTWSADGLGRLRALLDGDQP
ncbi:MAG: sigma-70 family RNA polymerase sigma factor [Planctomycetaceae bacterium]|nr:sigma-70 family RNA polymerase sigma factor [Planctomycetaceae bacterium]